MNFYVKAPSNIALIKYMGKSDAALNLPENASVSMTLDALCTCVELSRESGGPRLRWAAEVPAGFGDLRGLKVPKLDGAGLQKLDRHVARMRERIGALLAEFGMRAHPGAAEFALTLRSANSFPPASGIASSASSFAAITLASALAFAEDPRRFLSAWESDLGLRRALAGLSRQGSGSSCRSFEGPFVFWEGEEVRALASGMPALAHFVLLVSSDEKSVSSSQAHARIKGSPLWAERKTRLAARTQKMLSAIETGDLAAASRLAWTESWEMHSLFHTAEEPFSYWRPGSIEALEWLSKFITGAVPGGEAPPIVTMDAGPNVHVIVREADRDEWRSRLRARFPDLECLEDRPGRGATAFYSEGPRA